MSKMKVERTDLVFCGQAKLRKATRGIVLHHSGMVCATPARIHAMHRDRGWRGAGYHYLVAKDGTVYALRPEEEVGAHCGTHTALGRPGYENNRETLAVCFEGCFEPLPGLDCDEGMEERQIKAARALIAGLCRKYPDIAYLRGHGQMPGAQTSCPGRYFPLAAFAGLTPRRAEK
ncbi:MAG: peptidoglycan recognition family protein [Eubacteriales bacterium]|nr:peptidoglycan recognition family protein [Eubacteriales bacterium]